MSDKQRMELETQLNELKELQKTLTVMTVSEILAYKDPDQDKIVIDSINGTVTLNFDYPYQIDLDPIKTEGDLLRWTLSLTEKSWMNLDRLNTFIRKVAKHKKFLSPNIYE
jgi:hypothetical protein